MVYDVFTYNGERDMLEIRLNALSDSVDEFVICEAPTTFSGRRKPLYFEKHKERFNDFLHKIRYYVIDENYTEEEINIARRSPNTKGASHWKHEFLQKESIKKALVHLKDDDVVLLGDCDELWDPIVLGVSLEYPLKLKLRVYTYFLNNRSTEQFYGPVISKYKWIKNKCFNHVRTNSQKSIFDFGWHFTSMGGYKELSRKLTDSYTEESYATKPVIDNLKNSIDNNKDFLGRNFGYKVDESEWPSYLKENRGKYKHLLRK